MRLSRGFLILAIVAALWGSPSSVSAAVNELSSPQVSPGTGSVTTAFTFRVRYEGGFSAATVDVTVAGLTVPMVLESGSLTAGWWSGTGALPAGAWSTSFRATAVRGPSATVAGPAVTVAGATTPPATAGPTSPGSGDTPESAPIGPLDPTAPPAAPAPPPEETADTTGAGATPAPAAPDPDAAPAGSGESEVPSGDGSAAMPEPGVTGDDVGDAPAADGAPAASAASAPVPTSGMSRMPPAAGSTSRDERAATDELVSHVLLLGLAGVASVAVVGTLLLVAGRRREPEQAPANAAPSVAKDAALRRIAREDRGRAADDPIVAALGVDDEMAARRAIRRAQREAPDENRHPARRPRER